MLARDTGSFYTGELAERAVAALRAAGAPFSGDEWAGGATVPTEQPLITGRYAGATVHQTPLPSAGWMVLQQAALCDGVVGHTPWLGADAIDYWPVPRGWRSRIVWNRAAARTPAPGTCWRPSRIDEQRARLADAVANTVRRARR